jgi:hypothetical protein
MIFSENRSPLFRIMRRVTAVLAGFTRHSRTQMVLTAYSALSPVNGLSCHRYRRDANCIVADLTPASRRQDHTTSPSVPATLVSAKPKRPPHPARNVCDDRDTPLNWSR